MQDFMGKDGFSWFVGVVEDRNDPSQLGRVRVRVLGRHSENLAEVKTTDLPWAHVMHPVTDPSMQGLGHTPTFLTQGSWVVGFFRDIDRQQPVIMGSLPGVPEAAADYNKGFNDPRGEEAPQERFANNPKVGGPYPGEIKHSGHSINEPDTNRLARGKDSESHNSMIKRRKSRYRGDPTTYVVDLSYYQGQIDPKKAEHTGIPTATKPFLENVSEEAEQETRGFWEEPNPKSIIENANPYISAAYPYNHVFESESGHITEVDDSPGAERMFRQHMAGTFEEIHPDGSVVTKIIGDNYEIVIGSENIVIKGSQNITVEGSVRELIKGDYIQEIEGDFFQKIHKNHRVKVGAANDKHPRGPGGNREEEVVGNHAYNINEDVNGRIGGDVVINSEKSKWEIIAGQYTMAVGGEKMDSNPTGSGIYITSSSDYLLSVNSNISQSTISGIVSIKSGDTLNMKSAAAMTINPETTLTQTVGTAWTSTTGTTWTHTSTGNVAINGARIDLN